MTPSGQQDDQALALSSGQSARSSAREGRGDRDTFGRDELAIVLSHYDIGVIKAIQEFPRGSRRSPKLLIRTDSGIHLLKRRARGKDDARKVAFTHSLQIELASHQFPLPQLRGTRRENNSMLRLGGAIYELFEYIKGTGYDGSLAATQDSGKTLGLFHKLLKDYQPEYDPPRGSYHAAQRVQAALDQAPRSLVAQDPRAAEQRETVERIVETLRQAYDEAAGEAEKAGIADWPQQIIHCDWHPGNMLYRGERVVAVIDFDAARMQPRIIDAANGALQFSVTGGGDDATSWPDYLDRSRYKRFLYGYDLVNQLTRAELAVTPWLMIEALIAESAIPIAATGSFSRMGGLDWLLMIDRKIRWIRENVDELGGVLGT